MSLPSEQREGKLLTAVVQGANFLDLRELCAKELVKIGFDGYNFGGYVLDDEGDLVVEELRCVYENTPMDKFNYAMGLGRPEDILEAAKIGYTVFDTVIPTRNARHGSIFTSDAEDGTIRIRNSSFCDDMSPLEKSCNCTTCQNYSRSYIHHMLKGKEMTGMTLATIHNLRFYNRLTELLNRKKEELENIQYKEVLAILRKSES
jgi:queuine tRNA-ribosyltransferase